MPIMLKMPNPDGTEGIANCSLTVPDETDGNDTTKSFQGCICLIEENVLKLLQQWINPKDDQNLFKKYKYLLYLPYSEVVTKKIKKVVIQCSKHNEKTYELERQLHPILVDKAHAFIVCEHQELTKEKKCSFLKDHSMNVRLHQTLGKEIYGHGKLKVNEEKIGFIKFKITKCEESSSLYNDENDEYDVKGSDFEKLSNSGPILLADRKTLVGSFVKEETSCRISCSLFNIPGYDARTGEKIPSTKVPSSGEQETQPPDNESPTERLKNEEKRLKEQENKKREDLIRQLEVDEQQIKERLREEIKQLKQQQNDKLAEEKRQQLNERLAMEEKYSGLLQHVEKLNEENKQLNQQRIEELKEDKRKLEKDNKELKRENSQLKQQQNDKLAEEKRQLEQQPNDMLALEDKKRALEQHTKEQANNLEKKLGNIKKEVKDAKEDSDSEANENSKH